MPRGDTTGPVERHVRCEVCDAVGSMNSDFCCRVCSARIEILGLAEVTELVQSVAKISKQRVHQYTQERIFPLPFQRLQATPLWARGDILHWIEENTRRFRAISN